MPDAKATSVHPSLVEALQGAGARLLSHVPGAAVLRLLGERPHVVDGMTLDPHVQLVRMVRRRRRIPPLSAVHVDARRATYRRETASVTGTPTPVAACATLRSRGETARSGRGSTPHRGGPANVHRSWFTCTEGASPSATWRRTTNRAGCWRATRGCT